MARSEGKRAPKRVTKPRRAAKKPVTKRYKLTTKQFEILDQANTGLNVAKMGHQQAQDKMTTVNALILDAHGLDPNMTAQFDPETRELVVTV